MSEETNILAQIDRYLEGNLNEMEKGVFEQNLSNSVDMQDMLEATLLAEQVVVGYEVLKLKQQMAKDLAKPKINTTAIILGLVAILGAGIGIYYINNYSYNKSQIETPILTETTKIVEPISGTPKTVLAEDKVKPKVETKPIVSQEIPSEIHLQTEANATIEVVLPLAKEEPKPKMRIVPKHEEVKYEVIQSIQSKNTQVADMEKKSVVNEFTFNPAYDQAWPIPYDENKKPKSVSIMDKTGRAVYETSVLGTQPSEWNGESNTGVTIGIGYHVYLIEYTDGSVDKGAITILR